MLDKIYANISFSIYKLVIANKYKLSELIIFIKLLLEHGQLAYKRIKFNNPGLKRILISLWIN